MNESQQFDFCSKYNDHLLLHSMSIDCIFKKLKYIFFRASFTSCIIDEDCVASSNEDLLLIHICGELNDKALCAVEIDDHLVSDCVMLK